MGINSLDVVGEHVCRDGWYCCEKSRLGMAERIAHDECVMVRLPGTEVWQEPWCVTHGVFSSPGHAYDKGHLGTLD